MPNPALSQAEFDEIFDRILEPLNAYLALREMWRRFVETKVRIDEIDGNGNGFTSSWTFTSFNVKSLVAGGLLYVRIEDETPGAGQARVSLYRDTGAGSGDLVSQGSGNDSTTITLTEQNSSGIAATVAIGAVSADEANDKHYLAVFPDYPRRAREIFDGTESQDVGPENMLSDWLADQGLIASQLLAAMDVCTARAEAILRDYVSDKIQVSDVQSIFLAATTVDSSSGAVTVTKSGLIEELRLVMGENTTAQGVLQKVPTAGSVSADSTNRGKLSFGTITLSPNARPGLVSLKATKGGTSNFGSEEVTATLKPNDNGGPAMNDRVLTARRRLRPGAVFRAPELGIESVTATRDVDKSGDTNPDFDSADIAVTGESPDNTDGGKLYGRLSGSSGNWTVSFYSDSGVNAEDLVAQATGIADGGSFTAAQQNSSGLTVTGDLDASPSGGVTVTFDLNGLEADSNDGNVPDRWSFSISDPSPLAEGIQDTVGEIWGPSAELREVASSETIPDGRLTRGGPHPLRKVAS